ncbi:hypothetical protein GC176_08945 [bacterium]|nr:hypothetical protein [bacterium]
MKRRPFYLLALMLLTAVLPISIASQTRAARTATTAARASAARASGTLNETELSALRLETRLHAQASGRLSVLAAGIFICGVGAWGFSLSRKEGGLQGVPLLLLTAMGVLVQLIRV